MADNTPQKTRVLGYLPIAVLESLPEWKAYSAAVKLADRQRTKTAFRELIKARILDLPDDNEIKAKIVGDPKDAILDFINFGDGRLQVYQDLQPKKGTGRRGTDLSDLFAVTTGKPDRKRL